MADPRFFDNRGPFSVARICALADLPLADGGGETLIHDVAGLSEAGALHLSFFAGGRAKEEFRTTKAGWCLVGAGNHGAPPAGTRLLPAKSVSHAFAAVARLFYPEHELDIRAQPGAIDATARIAADVVLEPGVVVGAGAEIGERTHIGANSVIGRGVTIGRNCRIGPQVSLRFAHVGDEVVIQSGARIGGSGFGFASAPGGHTKIPQLGRVIVQDRVEIGANTTIDRGALADTVIGEGSKIDNLVQIGHNSVLGRHCIIVGQVGISGSVTLGDYVVLGGMVGVADHVRIGDRARVAAKSGVTRDLPAGRDYGGFPARPLMEWRRETAAVARLAKTRKRHDHE